MRKTNGFTLIELVVVIVILGVLAVTAAPRFLNLQTDAKNSALLGLKGAIESAMAVSYGKLAIEGLENETSVSSFSEPKLKDWCEVCFFTYGYPANVPSMWPYLVAELSSSTNGNTDWKVGVPESGSVKAAFSFPENFTGTILNEKQCYIEYTPPRINQDTEQFESYKLEMIPCE